MTWAGVGAGARDRARVRAGARVRARVRAGARANPHMQVHCGCMAGARWVHGGCMVGAWGRLDLEHAREAAEQCDVQVEHELQRVDGHELLEDAEDREEQHEPACEEAEQ